jgi:hypothetical protein
VSLSIKYSGFDFVDAKYVANSHKSNGSSCSLQTVNTICGATLSLPTNLVLCVDFPGWGMWCIMVYVLLLVAYNNICYSKNVFVSYT